jgi:hypothetical protein
MRRKRREGGCRRFRRRMIVWCMGVFRVRARVRRVLVRGGSRGVSNSLRTAFKVDLGCGGEEEKKRVCQIRICCGCLFSIYSFAQNPPNDWKIHVERRKAPCQAFFTLFFFFFLSSTVILLVKKSTDLMTCRSTIRAGLSDQWLDRFSISLHFWGWLGIRDASEMSLPDDYPALEL